MRKASFLKALSGAVSIALVPTSVAAEPKNISVDCISKDSEVVRAPTEAMSQWLSMFAGKYNSESKFTIGAHGAMNRVFHPSGRLLHPMEIANLVRSSKSFTGDKANLVELGISGTDGTTEESYSSRVSKALGTNVEGCAGIAYYFSNGLYICASAPNSETQFSTRSLPIGFTPYQFPMFMMLCVNADTAPDPRQLISSQAVFGLFSDEFEILESKATTEPNAAFRLYQYFWIARNDKASALHWLEKAAQLGSEIAQYNLAYEKFESGNSKLVLEAQSMVEKLAINTGKFPDLRKFYDQKDSK